LKKELHVTKLQLLNNEMPNKLLIVPHSIVNNSSNLINFVTINCIFMRTVLANQKLDALISNVEQHGVSAPNLVQDLKDLRESALLEQDPLVVKVLRLTYEFLEENNAFDVEAQYEEDEEGNEYPIEIDDKENLLYLLNLLKNAEHKINREEIKDYRTSLKMELY
jgi:hypothetical protein